jgi:hypothetical protein
VSGLPGAHDDAAALNTEATAARGELTLQPSTQAPVKEKKTADTADDATFLEDGFTQVVTREVTSSAEIPPDDMVATFVSAILCSLDGFQTPREITSFTVNQKVEEEALCLHENSYEWGTFRTTYQGHMKWSGSWKPWSDSWKSPKSFYLYDHLGMGSTSKVYRALTPDGYDCVVKIYVKRRGDDKIVLSEKEFDKQAKAAVEREVKAYKTIYGDELKGYVWQQTLNGFHCVIHPYFSHPEKGKRLGLLPLISDRLKNCFKKHNKVFAQSDQLWRHVGWFNGKLYLFDLADLEGGTGDFDDNIALHIERLNGRLPDTPTEE